MQGEEEAREICLSLPSSAGAQRQAPGADLSRLQRTPDLGSLKYHDLQMLLPRNRGAVLRGLPVQAASEIHR